MRRTSCSRSQPHFCSENTHPAISALSTGMGSSQLGLTLESALPKHRLGVLAQASVTKHCRLSSLNNRHGSLTILEAASPRSMCRQIQCLVRALFLACRRLPSLSVNPWWRKRALVSLPLPIRMLIPMWGPTLNSSSKPNYLLTRPPPNTITLRLRASMYEFGEDTNIQSSCLSFVSLRLLLWLMIISLTLFWGIHALFKE